ncbi:hypothetical protein DEU29_102248 [Idiomarina aquatica]|uniref:Uncharacterized protein n=1 Tax=Idiomarina aquatica TaxID=1327752 RepID=A0A4R6PT76_9GAMM|nr:hypothetical protein [Idiomarina aquatica]TDP40347.1 hypothetical protein DEU29_102248 [Idiomarina aquatica]
MAKVYEAKIARCREAVTSELTSEGFDLEAAEKVIAAYCTNLQFYSDELKVTQPPETAGKLMKEELTFLSHAISRLKTLQNDRRDALLELAKGRKAKSKY